jgi:acyl-CoA thioester hydrolase
MEGFHFSTDVRVRFSETDAQGVVHNAVYLVWFEIGRIAYIEQYPGGYKGLVASGVDVTTIEARIRYLAACRFDDRLTVHVRARDVKGARFRFEYAITRSGEVVADGWTAHACVASHTLRPTRMPPGLRETIAEIEAGSARGAYCSGGGAAPGETPSAGTSSPSGTGADTVGSAAPGDVTPVEG